MPDVGQVQDRLLARLVAQIQQGPYVPIDPKAQLQHEGDEATALVEDGHLHARADLMPTQVVVRPVVYAPHLLGAPARRRGQRDVRVDSGVEGPLPFRELVKPECFGGNLRVSR